MKTILILDDEPEICLLLAAILKGLGFSTIQSTTISEARQRLQKNLVDLLFMDINLSDGNGILEVPQMQKLNPGLHIVLMSAFYSPEITTLQETKAIHSFMSKPFSRTDVVSIINELFPKVVS